MSRDVLDLNKGLAPLTPFEFRQGVKSMNFTLSRVAQGMGIELSVLYNVLERKVLYKDNNLRLAQQMGLALDDQSHRKALKLIRPISKRDWGQDESCLDKERKLIITYIVLSMIESKKEKPNAIYLIEGDEGLEMTSTKTNKVCLKVLASNQSYNATITGLTVREVAGKLLAKDYRKVFPDKKTFLSAIDPFISIRFDN